MSPADWTVLANSLSSGDCARGVTSGGPAKPSGVGTFVYGANSLGATEGCFGVYASPQAPTNFDPLVKGGDISAAIQRAPGGGLADFDVFLFLCLGGTDVSDEAYMLGLSNNDPSHIELRKGSLAGGLPDEAPNPTGVNKILRRSTGVVAVGSWVHLKLEAVVNDNGDVVLNAYQSDLGSHAVGSPSWTAIPGVASFTDDALGVATGSLPYTVGRVGFGGTFQDVARWYVDHVTISKQV